VNFACVEKLYDSVFHTIVNQQSVHAAHMSLYATASSQVTFTVTARQLTFLINCVTCPTTFVKSVVTSGQCWPVWSL